MPYPEAMVQPMRQELTQLGVEELTTADAVDEAFEQAQDGTQLLVINSVCGCAAGNARPAVSMALQHDPQPDHLVTVFAGQDLEATERAREYLAGIPPSSPFMAVLRHGDPVYVIERKHIEGRNASAIATDLTTAFDLYCSQEEPPDNAPSGPDVQQSASGDLPPTFRSFK
jgi:putative YphP/YqiW family bacilliredoxin